MSLPSPDLLGVEEALARIASSQARVLVIALPTSRNSSHLRAESGAPQRIADALVRDEGNPYAENGADLGDRRNIEYIGALAGLRAVRGSLPIVHFDAHPDLYDELLGNRLSHASPFARIMENGLASDLWQYGIRTLNPHQREQVARFGVRCHEMRDHASWPLPTQPGPVVGADVVEYLPQRDVGGITAVVAAKLARELAGMMLGAAPR